MLRIIIDVLLAAGVFFALAGVIGVGLGSLLYTIFVMHAPATAVKVCVIVALILITNPVGAHAIAKGAYQAGIRPEKKMEIDDYRRDFDE